jgi:hypothetical protein
METVWTVNKILRNKNVAFIRYGQKSYEIKIPTFEKAPNWRIRNWRVFATRVHLPLREWSSICGDGLILTREAFARQEMREV